MTKAQRSDIEWAFDALQTANRKLWEAEREVERRKLKLDSELDKATSTPEGA